LASEYGRGKLTAQSAGTKIALEVNSVIVKAMKEKGIDIPTNKTKLLTQKMANDADLIITMGHGGSGSCSSPFFE
jgi:protein-tyrosine-phosphatase